MKLAARTEQSEGRFARLLSREVNDGPLHDQVLLADQEWIAAPSLGAIVPGWLIVVPRRPCLNFRRWAVGGDAPVDVLGALASKLGLSAEEYIWFEHGPAELGTMVGCGVDYAHLHMLIRPSFSFESFVQGAASGAELQWTESNVTDAYGLIPLNDSYLVIGNGDQAFFAHNVEAVGSQYLRRVIAKITGHADRWNYRLHPQHENIAETVQSVCAMRAEVAVD